MTDLEGVAGVLNFAGWCEAHSRYYEKAKALLTREVNAAVEGFLEGGADEILVADGHGWGAIDPELLDTRVLLAAQWDGGFPSLLDESFDYLAFVGQHAKAGTPFAHIAHTGNPSVLDLSVNGISVGEFGQLAFCACEMGVRTIFGSGDRAFALEAQGLFPGIETVEVKRGTTPGSGDDVIAQQYLARSSSAVHRHPATARQRIGAGARRALERAASEDFGLRRIETPYEAECRYRPDADFPYATVSRVSGSSDMAALINQVKRSSNRRPVEEE